MLARSTTHVMAVHGISFGLKVGPAAARMAGPAADRLELADGAAGELGGKRHAMLPVPGSTQAAAEGELAWTSISARVDRDDAQGGHPEVAGVIRQARMSPLPRRRLVISLLLLPGVRRGGFDGGQSAGLHGNHPLDANAAAHDIPLRDKPGVATQSIGEEPNSRVVVLPRNV